MGRVTQVQDVKRKLLDTIATAERALARNVVVTHATKFMPYPDRAEFYLQELKQELGFVSLGFPTKRALDRLAKQALDVRAQTQDHLEQITLKVMAELLTMLGREPSAGQARIKILRAHEGMLQDYGKHLGPGDWMDRFYRQRISLVGEPQGLVQ